MHHCLQVEFLRLTVSRRKQPQVTPLFTTILQLQGEINKVTTSLHEQRKGQEGKKGEVQLDPLSKYRMITLFSNPDERKKQLPFHNPCARARDTHTCIYITLVIMHFLPQNERYRMCKQDVYQKTEHFAAPYDRESFSTKL